MKAKVEAHRKWEKENDVPWHPGMEMELKDVVQTYKKRDETLAERMERERLAALEENKDIKK